MTRLVSHPRANASLAAQYLLLFELSLPFGLDLNDRVNIDKSATRVTATVGQLPTKDVRALLDAVGGLAGSERSRTTCTQRRPARR